MEPTPATACCCGCAISLSCGAQIDRAVLPVVLLHDAKRPSETAVPEDRRGLAPDLVVQKVGEVRRIIHPARPVHVREILVPAQHRAVVRSDAVGRDDRALVDAVRVARHRVRELHHQPVLRTGCRLCRGRGHLYDALLAVERERRRFLAEHPCAHRACRVDVSVELKVRRRAVRLKSVLPVRRQHVYVLIALPAARWAARDNGRRDVGVL